MTTIITRMSFNSHTFNDKYIVTLILKLCISGLIEGDRSVDLGAISPASCCGVVVGESVKV